jgi:hypothetical protein
MGQSDYSIHVTDQANVWGETLDRKAICIRAWSESTTIDPSDTPENMRKFLSMLQSALDASNASHDQTEVSLSKGSASLVGEDGIMLKATCQLPGFEPLVWSFLLKKSPPSAITSQLIIPLIEALYYKSRQVASLNRALSNKDSVIAKLSDKLEATGTGLEHVFTALSGRKKVSQAAAQDKIKGLGPFSEREIYKELENDTDEPNSASDLLERVFGGPGLKYHPSLNIDEAPALDSWWKDFSGTSSLVHRGGSKRASSKPRTPSPAPAKQKTDDDDDDDEFQIQATPPRLRSGGKSDEPKQASPSPPPDPAVQESKTTQDVKKPTGKKLGAIGGKKQRPARHASSSPPPKSPTPAVSGSTAKAAADDDETASETASDVDETASLPDNEASSSPAKAPPSSPPNPAGPAKKGVLGRIGGGAAKRNADVTPSDESKTTTREARGEPATTTPKKVGVIGKRIGGGTAAAKDDTGRGRDTSRKSEEEAKQEPRETSQERADRKREELKRELEKKAAAGPAKKKRRF